MPAALRVRSDSRLLRETVYEQLRADMISCRLAPGTEIRENELAARFGVSKSPVRDALMRLEREGLVITLPRQGYRVAPVSVADVQDMFHLRDALERACMERIVRRASDEQLAQLDSFRTFDGATWDGGFVAYNRDFHHALARMGGNARMRDQLIDLIDQIERAVQLSLSSLKKGDPQVAGGRTPADHRCAAGPRSRAGPAPGESPRGRGRQARDAGAVAHDHRRLRISDHS